MILHKTVKLFFEDALKDKYERILAHVIFDNDSYLNSMLVEEGYARVEIIAPNIALQDYFYKLQDMAIRESKGMWGLPEGKQPFVKNKKGNYIPRYR
jgi:micrococcal nuclease